MTLSGETVNPTSFFSEGLFTRRVPLMPSGFIRAMHPKATILPDPTAIQKILKAEWVGQLKIHGHRAQIHIPADPDSAVIVYTRQGTKHKKGLPLKMEKELRRIFKPQKGWNVLDSEWLKEEDK